ncbi:MAG TPA: carboxymuconolactone decarboxylase family protein [Caulobacteraceae bacterium]|nr:carboxymuconolactone decarboxylase family protein [Caulobacteraceae bacterium]
MNLDSLRESLPAYARDIATNLGVLASETLLDDQQKWGTFVASAHAVGVPEVVRAIEASATLAGLSDEAKTAAKAAAAVMGMNNVYYRALHIMGNGEYRALPARLRMNVLGNPGVPKVDFELWSMAVSAINGCGACMDAHEAELKKHEVSPQAIQATLRIGAVVNAASRVVAAEAAEAG